MLGSFATPQMNPAWFLIVSLLNLASFPKVRSRLRFCQVAACPTVFFPVRDHRSQVASECERTEAVRP